MTVDGIVLVHGSNLSALCWDPVVDHLDAATVAVDLPGRGCRPADILGVALGDCVEAVVETSSAAGFSRIALVGHSLGGVVISEALLRHPGLVAELIYVGALVPAPGESASDIMFGADLPAGEERMPTEDRAKVFFANDMTDEQWLGVWNQFVPESPTLWNARLSGRPTGVPMTYISLIDDIGVPPDLALRMIANIGGQVDHRVLQAGHIAMVTKPRELAEVINDVVNC